VINDILDLSQMETGKLKLKKEPFNLKRTIRTAFHMFDATYHNEQVKLVLQMDDIPLWVAGDAQRLTQIIVNLLNNAIKFTTHGSIALLVNRCPQGLEFRVRDTGTGIAQEKLQHIFEQFEQVHSLHRKKGHGLGLSITKQLVEAQHGRIQVNSVEHVGSEFSFWLNLPTCEPQLQQSELIQHKTYANDSFTILIVDDQPLNRLLVKKVLEKAWPNSYLIEAEHGLQAIDAHRQHSVDLILMDVLMPEMDGITATLKIRTELPDEIRQVPIIGLTANAYETTKQDCLIAGMNDVIYKPFNRDELIQRIEELTHTTQTA
jgi:CheY-like chemotaxis protein